MSDPVTKSRTASPCAEGKSAHAAGSASPELSPGVTHRLDPAHPLPPPTGAASSEAAETCEPHRHEEELLLQASQIAEHLRGRFAELDRREHTLNTQLSEFDQERRSFRLWAAQLEEEVNERASRINAKEQELQQRAQTCEKLLADVEDERQHLAAQQRSLATERQSLRAVLDKELQQERDQLALAQQQLEAQRNTLRKELVAELDAERAEFHDRQAKWEQQQNEELQKLEDLLQHTRAECEEERDRIVAEQQQQVAELQQQQSELAQELRTLRETIEAERAEHAAALEQAAHAWEAEQEKQRSQLQQQKTLHEKRIRFEQAHLKKVQQQLEEDRRSVRLAQQRARQHGEEFAATARMRRLQLDHYAGMLEQREASVDRERQLLSRVRRAQQDELQRGRAELSESRRSWKRECEMQREEIRGQQERLAAQTELLDQRSTQLDQFREELEQTHHETLQLQLAIDEVWSRMTERTGESELHHRIAQAREMLLGDVDQMRRRVQEKRRELEQQELALVRQRESLQREQAAISEWAAKQHAALETKDTHVQQRVLALEQRESRWNEARDQWLQQRLEAEAVIRELLRQLTAANLADPEALSAARSAGLD